MKSLPLSRDVRVKNKQKGELVVAVAIRPQKVLLIVPEYDESLVKSCRNIPYLTLRYAPNFSVRDVISAGRVVLSKGAVIKIEEVLAK